jgi:hypothetical protein
MRGVTGGAQRARRGARLGSAGPLQGVGARREVAACAARASGARAARALGGPEGAGDADLALRVAARELARAADAEGGGEGTELAGALLELALAHSWLGEPELAWSRARAGAELGAALQSPLQSALWCCAGEVALCLGRHHDAAEALLDAVRTQVQGALGAGPTLALCESDLWLLVDLVHTAWSRTPLEDATSSSKLERRRRRLRESVDGAYVAAFGAAASAAGAARSVLCLPTPGAAMDRQLLEKQEAASAARSAEEARSAEAWVERVGTWRGAGLRCLEHGLVHFSQRCFVRALCCGEAIGVGVGVSVGVSVSVSFGVVQSGGGALPEQLASALWGELALSQWCAGDRRGAVSSAAEAFRLSPLSLAPRALLPRWDDRWRAWLAGEHAVLAKLQGRARAVAARRELARRRAARAAELARLAAEAAARAAAAALARQLAAAALSRAALRDGLARELAALRLQRLRHDAAVALQTRARAWLARRCVRPQLLAARERRRAALCIQLAERARQARAAARDRRVRRWAATLIQRVRRGAVARLLARSERHRRAAALQKLVRGWLVRAGRTSRAPERDRRLGLGRQAAPDWGAVEWRLEQLRGGAFSRARPAAVAVRASDGARKLDTAARLAPLADLQELCVAGDSTAFAAGACAHGEDLQQQPHLQSQPQLQPQLQPQTQTRQGGAPSASEAARWQWQDERERERADESGHERGRERELGGHSGDAPAPAPGGQAGRSAVKRRERQAPQERDGATRGPEPLYGGALAEHVAQAIASGRAPALRQLSLSNCALPAAALAELWRAAERNTEALRALRVHESAPQLRLGDAQVAATLQARSLQLSRLHTLELRGLGLGDRSCAALCAALAGNAALEVLGLERNKIACKGAAWLAHLLPRARALREARFADNRIADHGAAWLAAALPSAASLTRLGLESNSISTLGAVRLEAALAKAPHVHELALHGNPAIKDAIVRRVVARGSDHHLARFLHLPAALCNTEAWTPDDVRRFASPDKDLHARLFQGPILQSARG